MSVENFKLWDVLNQKAVLLCQKCGALVPGEGRDAHSDFHARNEVL